MSFKPVHSCVGLIADMTRLETFVLVFNHISHDMKLLMAPSSWTNNRNFSPFMDEMNMTLQFSSAP